MLVSTEPQSEAAQHGVANSCCRRYPTREGITVFLQHDDQHDRRPRVSATVNQMAERVLWREPSEQQGRWLLDFPQIGWENSMTRHVLHGISRVRPARFEGRRRSSLGC